MPTEMRDMRDPASLGKLLDARKGGTIRRRADFLDKHLGKCPTYLDANPLDANPNVRPPALRQHLVSVDGEGKVIRDPLADIG